MAGSSLKRLAKDWIPPALHSLLRRHLRRPAPWEYVGQRWPENDRRVEGWDHPSVTRTLEERWLTYIQRARSSEPWAFWPWDTTGRDAGAHHNLLSFAYAVARAAGEVDKPLTVLDWGGAFGHFYLIARAATPLTDLIYTVKDRPSLCSAGARLNPEVRFVSSNHEVFASRYELVLASNALQYAPDWRSLIASLAQASNRWLLILALPVVRQVPEFVVVQRPQGFGFAEDYISWIFNRGEFLARVGACGFAIEREFLSIGPLDATGAPEIAENVGFLFRRTQQLRN
jgi:putative methyltransferase (TIGR04325 family)